MALDWKNWGLRLQALRRHLGWSQGELATKLGVARNTVNRWEIGDRHPSIGMLEQLAAVLQVPGNSLLPAKRLRGQDPDVATEAHRFDFDARLLFNPAADFSLPLARLMMATDDVRHIQRLLIVQYEPKNPTPSERAIVAGEVGHLFRLLCSHLFEAIDAFATLDSKCQGLLRDAVQTQASETERVRAGAALERVLRARHEIFSKKGKRRSFIAIVRNLVGFHYPDNQKLGRTITRHLQSNGIDAPLKGRVVLTPRQGIGRYSVTDDILKHVIADEIGGTFADFPDAYMKAIGEAIELAGALGDVVDYLLAHLFTKHRIPSEHTLDVIRIHPSIAQVGKQVGRQRRRKRA